MADHHATGARGRKARCVPANDRNALLLRGGPHAGGELPLAEWGAEFADNHMPDAILNAISAARSGGDGTIDDAAWRERLSERFGARWKIAKLRTRKAGTIPMDATQGGTSTIVKRIRKKVTKRNTPTRPGGTSGSKITGPSRDFLGSRRRSAVASRTTEGSGQLISMRVCSPPGNRTTRSTRRAQS